MPPKMPLHEAKEAVNKALKVAAELNQGFGFPKSIVTHLTGVSPQALDKAIEAGRVNILSVRCVTGKKIVFCAYEDVEKLGSNNPKHAERLQSIAKRPRPPRGRIPVKSKA